MFNPPDFKITTGVFVWNVHKNILSKHSTFFSNMLSEEDIEDTAKLPECPLTVAQMLMYMYHGRFTTRFNSPLVLGTKNTPVTLDRTLRAGYQYDYRNDDFQDEADSLCSRSDYWEHEEWDIRACTYMCSVAEKYGMKGLRRQSFVQAFEAVGRQNPGKNEPKLIWDVVIILDSPEMYIDTTDFKKEIIKYFASRINLYKKDPYFEEMVKRHNDIAEGISEATSGLPTT